eukprot:709794-Rhodomonas_salina.2
MALPALALRMAMAEFHWYRSLLSYVKSGTDLVYAAVRCPALTYMLWCCTLSGSVQGYDAM